MAMLYSWVPEVGAGLQSFVLRMGNHLRREIEKREAFIMEMRDEGVPLNKVAFAIPKSAYALMGMSNPDVKLVLHGDGIRAVEIFDGLESIEIPLLPGFCNINREVVSCT